MASSTNIYGFNIGGNNNSFDQRGHFYRAFLDGNVSGMLVKQNSTPNMTVLVEHGSALLNKNTISASIAEIKSDTSVAVDTANTANPRIDSIVIYEDTSVTIPTVEANYWQDGAGGRFKIVSLPGTAAASPTALTDANIQSAIGAGKPFARLANITVAANSTTILNSNINNSVRNKLSASIADGAVTAEKTAFGGNYATSEVNTGFTWVDGSPIYKKSVAFGSLPNNTNKNVAHGITNLSKVIKIEANQYEGVNRSAFPFTHGSNLSLQQQILIDATAIKVYTYADRTGVTIDYVTLYYTKS